MNINGFAQSFSAKGQLWTSTLTSNDVPDGLSSTESTLGYIPTLSLFKNLSNNQLVDIEWAYRLDRAYSGDSLLHNNESHHRYWVRYASEKLEARLGLQKIVFGPSFVLRSLSWFDTIDLKDPTGQTDGVEAFRLRWFPSNSLSIWSWTILNDQDTLSYGSRVELSNSAGEWGLTYHQDPSKSLKVIGQIGIPVSGSHNRIAIDYRYDGFIGFWNESALIKSNRSDIIMATIGADYTLPISNGILIMAEYMSISNKFDSYESSQSYTALMASMPLGMVHQLMFISQFDLEENRSYNYLRWSSTYDHYSLNFILSISPKRSQYLPITMPNSLAGFGTGFQFMFIYNH
ncbi:MAG: hypothetical protein HOI72_01640 [Candidatus Marinimicrobia bacterium]|nr:hypothetical protein [Candidatus Neomarinimicrobiota bacterium]MBT4661184.1 hypothetical protein [Candidatus Neomarinimicrobiota bacterium]MBT5224469.1 hypothetical protein [Candidatus Neomarinimicrobiota bacterium]MBT5720872.1 hypothetical protein [Candidatus Neomarinimicrobiota bacterium]MBT6518167.1 hypothetical protein [Candidatus Neomarinimicrobiota bacterium]